ncbi:MAG: hypothetical protein U0T82_14260 [Bacteroidales bacterium]
MSEGFIPATWLDLERARKQEEIVLLTAAQVMKDFAGFGIDIHFSGNPGTAYDELFHQLSEQVGMLIETNFLKLKALLYQIDVAERAGEKVLTDGSSYAEQLAVRILDREFMKVLTRLYFRQSSGKAGDAGNALR